MQSQSKIANSQKGFTMIELIITLAVLSFGIIGVYGAFTPLIYHAQNASLRLTAAYLAQEGMETIRNIRDNNIINQVEWSEGLLGCNLGCQADYKTGTLVETFENQLKAYEEDTYLAINEDGFWSYDVSNFPSNFSRKIIITEGDSSDVVRVDVQIFWNYNGQEYSFETAGFLYNWY